MLLSRSVGLAGNFDGDVFTALLGDVATAGKPAEELLDGNHANLHDRFLKIAEDPCW